MTLYSDPIQKTIPLGEFELVEDITPEGGYALVEHTQGVPIGSLGRGVFRPVDQKARDFTLAWIGEEGATFRMGYAK